MGRADSVEGSFNKQGNLLTRLVLSSGKKTRFLHPPARILRVYIEALARFRYLLGSDGHNILLSQGCVLERALSVGMMD